MDKPEQRWAIASELADILHLSRGRISQLVRAGVLTPRRRHGKTMFRVDEAIADYERSIIPTIATAGRRAELRQQLAQAEAEVRQEVQPEAIDDDRAPLLPHGLASVARAGYAAFWWQVMLEDRHEIDEPGSGEALVDALLSGPQGQQVRELLRRSLRAAAATSWAAMADALAYDAPALDWLEDELWPTLAEVPLLREVAEAEGVDPDQGPGQWIHIRAPWEVPG